jgi:radical SAM protein with 4Fe4S-binding SPASM domain
LAKAFFSFVSDAKKFNVTVHTTSNLQLLDKAMAENMVKSGVDYLSFSCDGTQDETYAKIRINGTLDILKKNLTLLNDAKRKNKSSTPILTLNFGATRQNIAELPDIVKLANNYDVSKIIVFHNVAYLKAQSEDSLFHDQKLSDTNFRRALDMAEKLGMPIELPEFFSTPIDNDPKKFFCEFPVERTYIYHDGRVGPCSMDFPDRIILGNINEASLEEIWNDTPYLNLRKSINMKPSETCMFCVDSTKIDISDPRFLFRFKSNKAYINSIKS